MFNRLRAIWPIGYQRVSRVNSHRTATTKKQAIHKPNHENVGHGHFKVTFILINETLNLKLLFTYKEHQNKLHRFGVVYPITCSFKGTCIGQTSRNLITRLKNHDPTLPNR